MSSLSSSADCKRVYPDSCPRLYTSDRVGTVVCGLNPVDGRMFFISDGKCGRSSLTESRELDPLTDD